MHLHSNTLLLGAIQMLVQKRRRFGSLVRTTCVAQSFRRVGVLADDAEVKVRRVEEVVRQASTKFSASLERPYVDVDDEAVGYSKDHGDGPVESNP